MKQNGSAGGRLRAALAAEAPPAGGRRHQRVLALLAEAAGFRAIYLSGGGVAANSFGLPDLGITTLNDVLIDVRRITDATTCRCSSTSTPAGAARSTSRAR